ncbi:hypothetical protein [Sorangium sp. So ce861]|uniref:hypothetical protein n=1 Tax=Sorangium sp. So ce861 TaxID=3133323 RepID=UPI003F623485
MRSRIIRGELGALPAIMLDQLALCILLGLGVITVSDLASAQEKESQGSFYWDGFHLNGTLQAKLPLLLRLGVSYSGGTAPGAVHVVMMNFGQTLSLTKELNVGYLLGVGLSKESMSTLEEKVLGIHATFETGPFRASAATNLQFYALGEAIIPMFTTALRGQGAIFRTTHVDAFVGGDLFLRNLNVQFGATAGFRFRDVVLFDRNISGLLSATVMNTWANVPAHGLSWAAYVEPRLGVVVDLETKEEEKRDQIYEYGQY